jgi:hypothetical protein
VKAWARLESVLPEGPEALRQPVRLLIWLEDDSGRVFGKESEVIEADCPCLPQLLEEQLLLLVDRVGFPPEKARELLAAGVSLEGP